MKEIHLGCAGISVSIKFPELFAPFVQILFPNLIDKSIKQADISFKVQRGNNDRLDIYEKEVCLAKNLTSPQCSLILMNEFVRLIANHYKKHIAIHAAAVVKNGIAVVLPAQSGKGKTSLSAWLGFVCLPERSLARVE